MKFSSKFIHFYQCKCIWKCRLEMAAILPRPQEKCLESQFSCYYQSIFDICFGQFWHPELIAEQILLLALSDQPMYKERWLSGISMICAYLNTCNIFLYYTLKWIYLKHWGRARYLNVRCALVLIMACRLFAISTESLPKRTRFTGKKKFQWHLIQIEDSSFNEIHMYICKYHLQKGSHLFWRSAVLFIGNETVWR